MFEVAKVFLFFLFSHQKFLCFVLSPSHHSDNDGIPDSHEIGSDANNPVDTDNDGTPDYLDLDR